MATPPIPLGDFVRQRRLDLGLTQPELAKKVNISTDLVASIERNTRGVTQAVLEPLLAALGVEATYARALTSAYQGKKYEDAGALSAHELSALDAISVPACYISAADYTIRAANSAAAHSLPGLVAGRNAIEWFVADPETRNLFPEWETLVHRFLWGVKAVILGVMPDEARDWIVQLGERNVDSWDRLWSTPPEDQGPITDFYLADPVTGTHQRVYVTSFRLEFPRPDFWMWMFQPVPPGGAGGIRNAP